MRNTWLLLKVQLSALLGFNKIIHLKDKGERRKKLAGYVAILLCILIALSGCAAIAYAFGLAMNGLGQIGLFPGMMLAMTCVMTLITSVSMANGTLFAFKDYDLIMSLPVKPMEAAMSRLWLGYACNTLFDLMLMLPCGAVYAYFARPSAGFYPIFLLTTLAAPIPPMIVGSMIGALAARLTASLRGAKYLQMLGSMALCMGVMYLSIYMDSMEELAPFGDWGVMIGDMMNRIYPLTGLYVSAVRDLSWTAAALFVLISAALMACAALIMGKWLKRIHTMLNSSHAKRNYRMSALKTTSPLMALYKKELRRYVGSVPYLYNTAFVLVLAIVGVIVLAVKGKDVVRLALVALEITGVESRLIGYVLGYVGAFLILTECTTASSISLEGKSVWLLKSLPSAGFDILLSKIMVNLTLSVPTSLIIGLGASWALGLEADSMAAITAMCLAYSLASACLGLLINLKNHKFDWMNDAAVVKQGAAVGINMGVGVVLIFVPAALTFVFVERAQLAYWLTVLALTGVGAGLLGAFKVKGNQWIRSL